MASSIESIRRCTAPIWRANSRAMAVLPTPGSPPKIISTVLCRLPGEPGAGLQGQCEPAATHPRHGQVYEPSLAYAPHAGNAACDLHAIRGGRREWVADRGIFADFCIQGCRQLFARASAAPFGAGAGRRRSDRRAGRTIRSRCPRSDDTDRSANDSATRCHRDRAATVRRFPAPRTPRHRCGRAGTRWFPAWPRCVRNAARRPRGLPGGRYRDWPHRTTPTPPAGAGALPLPAESE